MIVDMDIYFKEILAVIDGFRHENYKKVVSATEKLRAYASGEGVYRYCKQFDLRETELAYKAKKDIIKPATPELIGKIENTYQYVFRANHQYIISGEKSDVVIDVLAKFCKDKNPAQFLENKLTHLALIEPNGFLVVECNGTDGTEFVKPYPFIVRCENVMNYQYSDSAELEYIVVKSKSKLKGFSKHTGYFPGVSIVFNPVVANVKTEDSEPVAVGGDNTRLFYGCVRGGVRYEIVAHLSGVNRVLAMPLGFIESETGFISPLDKIDASIANYIRRDIDSKITDAKTAYPTLLQYILNKTKTENPNQSEISQDESRVEGIEIPLDAKRIINGITADNLPDLDKFYKYAGVDIRTNEYLEKAVEKAENKVFKALFGHDYLSNPDKVKTAYEALSNDNSVYAALIPFDTHRLDTWKNIAKAVVSLMGLDDTVTVDYVQDLDYSLTTLGELLATLVELKNTNAPQYLQVAVMKKVIDKLFVGEPKTVATLKKMIDMDCFAGLAPEQIGSRLAMLEVPEIEKKRHLRLHIAMKLVENDNPDFLSFSDEKIRELIDSKIQ